MIKVLFVEDDEDAIKPILNQIQQVPGLESCVIGFDEAGDRIRSLRPDIVVLDLFEGDLFEKNNRGSERMDLIWKQQFCPVVVHSALPEVLPDYNNSFVRKVKKGQNSSEQVFDAIRDFLPHVQVLRGAEEHIRDSFSLAMRDFAPPTFELYEVDEELDEIFLRAGRRRLAAWMDKESAEYPKLASWEQYICPPIHDDVSLGDVLWKADGECSDPASYRVVLTPSCDLVSSHDRKPKVRNVLVANCCSTKKGFEQIGWKNIRDSKLKERLNDSVLSRGFFEFIMPIPKLKGRIPTMLANFRELELIPLSDIGCQEKPFLRIASLDSPFRELVSWAYLQVSGRPGVPDRDKESWCEEIMDDYRNQN